MNTAEVTMLGQAGCKLSLPRLNVYIDPYLSNSVEILDSPMMKRMIPIPIKPEFIDDADIILITHEHLDHCDPHTLPIISESSSKSLFVGPAVVLEKLRGFNISEERLILASEEGIQINGINIIATPASHPKVVRDEYGNLETVGFIIGFDNKYIYFSGDSNVCTEVIQRLIPYTPLHAAFLPVNEHNFFLGQKGITGNMSIREAFHLAELIGAQKLIPVHWDMFEINSAFPEEIELLYSLMKPNFKLVLNRKFDLL